MPSRCLYVSLLLALVASGCGERAAPARDRRAPAVSVAPDGGALGQRQSVVLTFTEPMDAEALVLSGSLAAQPHTRSWDDANAVLTVAPDPSWTPGPAQLTVDGRDRAGNALPTASFTYDVLDETPPRATVSPADVLGPRTPVVVRFDETVARESLVLAGDLLEAAHTLSWSSTTHPDDTVTITPTDRWFGGAGQLLSVQARDTAANAMATAHNVTLEVAVLRAFVTSVSGLGKLGDWPDAGGASGLAAGDAICNARAAAANLSGSFVAVLSDSTSDAYCRVHGLAGKRADNCGQAALPEGAGPWFRMDGEPFAASAAELFQVNGVVYSPVAFDELGNKVMSARYFTGTNESGALYQDRHCGDWKLTSGVDAVSGKAEATTQDWVWASLSDSCGNRRRLLCLELGEGAPLRPRAPIGKIIFITEDYGTGDISAAGGWDNAGALSGIDAADAICNAEAAGKFSGSFVALLSTSGINAVDRVTSNGPYVRPDGFRVAADKATLFSAMENTPHVTAAGAYSAAAAWTGSNDDGTADGADCADWAQGTSGGEGGVHAWPNLLTTGLKYAGGGCNNTFWLLCVQN